MGAYDGNVLIMTCHIQVIGPDGSTAEARGLMDSVSSASFISERLAQTLRLQRSVAVLQSLVLQVYRISLESSQLSSLLYLQLFRALGRLRQRQ